MTAFRRRARLGDDSGATLVLALLIITVVALVISAVLPLAQANLRTTIVVRGEVAQAATADAAAQVAINTLRQSPFNNDTSSTTHPECFGATATSDVLVLPNLVPGSTGAAANSAAVRCEADPATGAAGGLVPITAANKPGNAILTLSTNAAESGLDVKALNNSVPFAVHGGVVSNSGITVTNGSLVSSTSVHARGNCTGTITSTPARQCNFAGTLPGDPGYAVEPPSTPVMPYRVVPANAAANCPGKVMAFEPGYYNDAVALSELMAGNGACRGSVWWFKPGIYYFDFHNAASVRPAGVPSGTDEWLVKDGQIVAGTPTNAAGTVIAAPVAPATIPGACESPLKTTSPHGVQFVFGGDSRLALAGSADAEICGIWHANRPPIAVYGLKDTISVPMSTTGAPPAAVTASGFAPSSGSTLPVALATAGDNRTATWSYTAGSTGGSTGGNGNGNGNGGGGGGGGGGGTTPTPAPTTGTGSLTFSAFTPPGIPAGATVTGATLRLTYGTSSQATSRSLDVTTSAGTATIPIANVSARSPGATETVTLTAAQAAGLVTTGTGGGSVTYTSTMTATGSEVIDAVALDLTYTVPVRGENATSTCINRAYTTAGACAVLSTATSYAGRLFVQGTTYAPAAAVDLTLSNITAQVLRFGVVSRVLSIKETGAITYSGPVIELPDDSPGYGPGGTIVYLTVFVCPGSSTCSATGEPALRARVYINDPSGTPSPPSRQMIVQSWAIEN